jgi:HK97 gp10 family phage protein
MQTYGFDDFDKVLDQMGKDFGYTDVNKKTLVPALKKAMMIALPTAKTLAHRDTGEMAESIEVTSKRPDDKDKKSKYIYDSDAAIGLLSAKISDVSLGEEFGTSKKSAHPFIRPSIERNQTGIIDKLSSELTLLIEKYQARKSKDKPL